MVKAKKSSKKRAAGRATAAPARSPKKPHGAKAPAANEPERVERRRFTEKLPCAIAPEIVVLRADEQAKTWREREELMADNRERNAMFREQRAHLDKKLGELATSVEQHTESLAVDCVEYLVRDQIEVWRQDTLEMVTTRPATSEDLQEKIFDKIDKAKAEGNGEPWSEGENPAPKDDGVLKSAFGVPDRADLEAGFDLDEADAE